VVAPCSDRISRVPPYSRTMNVSTRTGLSPSTANLSRFFHFNTHCHWPGPRSLATTCGVSVDVLSCRYLDVSVPCVRFLHPILFRCRYLIDNTWKPEVFYPSPRPRGYAASPRRPLALRSSNKLRSFSIAHSKELTRNMDASRSTIQIFQVFKVGCPIRRSMDQSLFAAPHGFSQRITSFIACACLGIH
jgi:hypothetical protein